MSNEVPPRAELESLARRILSSSRADGCRVNIEAARRGNTRFAASEITTAGLSTDTVITVTSTVGRRRASATTNSLDEPSLRRAVQLSERLAKLSPDDPELMPELAAQRYTAVEAYGDSTARLDAEGRVQGARQGPRAGRREGAVAARGGVHPGERRCDGGRHQQRAFRTPPQHGREHVRHRAYTPDGTGSGWASAGAREWRDIDAGSLGARATRKALASRNPIPIDPGHYTVILEPQAVADQSRS